MRLTDHVALVTGGCRGIGELRPDTQPHGFASPEKLQPFVEVLRRSRFPLLTHASEPVGHGYAGKGKATPDLLYNFVSNFPDLTIICAHWGGGLPFYALMPEVGRALEKVYFDTAASPFLYRPEIYQIVSKIVGADKILFGSDFPLLPQGRVLREIESAGLAETTKKMILSGNAKNLLGLES